MLVDHILPLIDNDYMLLDDPYHANIGDLLIWGGEKQLLTLSGHRCLYSSSCWDYVHQNVPENTIIILHGGGNWGDLWRVHQEFRMRIMEEYPENLIIVLPQTVFYNDQQILEDDMALINRHQNVIICARDRYSYDLLNSKLDNTVMLLPDMAFMLELSPESTTTGRTLFLKRGDKELANIDKIKPLLPAEYEEHDWPTMEKEFPIYKKAEHPDFLFRGVRKIARLFDKNVDRKWKDYYWEHTILPFTIKTGVDFINQYDKIYTTRMHVGILGTLLGKDVTMFDNSYSKNKGFYDTWLSDVDNITLKEV